MPRLYKKKGTNIILYTFLKVKNHCTCASRHVAVFNNFCKFYIPGIYNERGLADRWSTTGI